MKPCHSLLGALTGAALALFAAPSTARAHCDTMDGPVVQEAMAALASGDVEPVLKWVPAEGEAMVREAFQHTLAVRALGPEAKALADRYFFETVVRLHRQGEGEPYTGIRRAGSPVPPVIVAADRALEASSVDELARLLAETAERGLRERFARTIEARQHASESVEKGRAYVAAYVAYIHHALRLQDTTTADASTEDDAPPSGTHTH